MRPSRRRNHGGLFCRTYAGCICVCCKYGYGREESTRKRTGRCHPCPMLPRPRPDPPPRTTQQQSAWMFEKKNRSEHHTFVLSESLVLVDYRRIVSFGGHLARLLASSGHRSRLWSGWDAPRVGVKLWHQTGTKPGQISKFLDRAGRATSAGAPTQPIPVVFSNTVMLQVAATSKHKPTVQRSVWFAWSTTFPGGMR